MAEEPQSSTIVSSEIPSRLWSLKGKGSWLKNHKKATTIATVAIVGVIVGAFIYIPKWQLDHRVNSPALKGFSTAQKVQYFKDRNDYEAANKVLQNDLTKTSDSKAQASLYAQLAALAVRSKDYKNAHTYADKIAKLIPNAPMPYVVQAQLAEAEGNKTAAKKYWQQAIAHIDPKADAANLIKLDYQRELDALK